MIRLSFSSLSDEFNSGAVFVECLFKEQNMPSCDQHQPKLTKPDCSARTGKNGFISAKALEDGLGKVEPLHEPSSNRA